MATESDHWQTAWIIAEQYGADGAAFAGQMALSFKIGHKLDAHRTWLSIKAKVEALTSHERSEPVVRQ